MRICELDRTMQSPTTKLLEGYTGATVDLKCEYNGIYLITVLISYMYNEHVELIALNRKILYLFVIFIIIIKKLRKIDEK